MADPTETKSADAGTAGGAGAGDQKVADKTESTSVLGSASDAKPEGDKAIGAADEKKVDEKKVEPKADDKPAPLELKLPDGVELDPKLVDGFKELAGKHALKADAAQAFLDRFVSHQQEQSKATDEAFTKQDAAWAAELKADADLGGAKWEATRADIGRAVKHFKSAGAAMKVLGAAGLGNNPELVRFVVEAGRAVREDSIAGSTKTGGAAERQPFEVVAYPTMKSSEKEQ